MLGPAPPLAIGGGNDILVPPERTEQTGRIAGRTERDLPLLPGATTAAGTGRAGTDRMLDRLV
jgi:hypothetical protein